MIYHLAAHISISKRDDKYLADINVKGTKNVIEACRLCNVKRLIHFSTIHSIYEKIKDENIDENSPLVDKNQGLSYDYSKALGEQEVLKAVKEGMDALIITPTAIIGPYDLKPSFMGRMLILLCTNRLFALVKGGFNWVDARDVSKGAIASEINGKRGEKYILGGNWLSLKELAIITEKAIGIKCRKAAVPMWLAEIGAPFSSAAAAIMGEQPLYTSESLFALKHHRNISHQKAFSELGYRPRPIEETLIDTVNWFKEYGYLK